MAIQIAVRLGRLRYAVQRAAGSASSGEKSCLAIQEIQHLSVPFGYRYLDDGYLNQHSLGTAGDSGSSGRCRGRFPCCNNSHPRQ
jgi:hypothetical protein